ncbi:MAG: HD-GYP domain-containing protein, partial [Gemmata sp.]
WDGGGYPDGLKGDATPLLARIVAVADAFDAMTSNRPYHENKKGKPPSWAFAEVEQQSGKQFDPVAAAAFVAMREEIVRAMAELLPGSELETPEPVTAAGLMVASSG